MSRKTVRLFLIRVGLGGHVSVEVVNALSAEKVARLVEEAEPELIVGLVPEAELDDRFVGRQPPRSPT